MVPSVMLMSHPQLLMLQIDLILKAFMCIATMALFFPFARSLSYSIYTCIWTRKKGR